MIDIPGYQIVKPLGRGGMAAVYLAIQESLDRHVALKVLSRHLSGEDTFNDRFLREARIAARFLHRSIVQIRASRRNRSLKVMAMEYLPGGTLGARMAELALKEKLVVAAEIADALDFMHRQAFIHRDVKPDNIIFRADDSAVITDFGIARAANSATRMTLTGSILGTPHYMSPEQARGKKIDSRSDLYSLGVVLFKMLAGRLPYDAEDQFSICAMHVNEPIPKLPEEVAHLQGVIDKLMAKDPEERFPTGAALLEDLEAVADTALLPKRTTGMSFETRVVGASPETEIRLGTEETRLSGDHPGTEETRAATGPTEPAQPSLRSIGDGLMANDRMVHSDGPSARTGSESAWLGALPSAAAAVISRPAIWAPALVLLALLGGAVWTLTRETTPTASADQPIAASQTPATRTEPVGSEVTDHPTRPQVDILATAQRFAESTSTTADWLWIDQLRARVIERDIEIDAAAWPQIPDSADLETSLLNQMDHANAGSLVAMVEATSEKWRAVAAESSFQPTESLLLNKLEQLARAATSNRLETALAKARQGQWDGAEGAWRRFEQTYALMSSENQRDSAMSELRLIWLNQWKTLMDAPDFDAANALFERAFEADVLGEDWLIQQSRQLSELEETLDEAAAEERIASLLEQAERALEGDRLMVPAGNNAFEAYQAVLDQDPDHPEARSGIRLIAERYAELARLALDRADFDSADQFIERSNRLAPDLAQLPELVEWRDSLGSSAELSATTSNDDMRLPPIDLRGDEPAGRLIEQGESALRSNRPLEGYAYLLAALRREPDNRTARRRLDQRAQRYIRLATRDVANGALNEARRNLAIVNLIAPDHPDYAAADRALLNAMDRVEDRASASRESQSNLTRLRLNVMLTEASTNLDRLTVDPGNQRLALQAAEKIEQAERIASHSPQVMDLADRHAAVLEEAARQMIDQERLDLAEWYIDQLTRVDPGNKQLTKLRQELSE